MNKVKNIVDKTINYYNTACPFEICKMMNIRVMYQELTPNVKGFFVKIFNKLTIIINIDLNEDERKSVCAHELGHIIMHDGTNSVQMINNDDSTVVKLEEEADNFAMYLLEELSRV